VAIDQQQMFDGGHENRHQRADFVAHVCQKLALDAARLLGGGHGFPEFLVGLLALRDIGDRRPADGASVLVGSGSALQAQMSISGGRDGQIDALALSGLQNAAEMEIQFVAPFPGKEFGEKSPDQIASLHPQKRTAGASCAIVSPPAALISRTPSAPSLAAPERMTAMALSP